MDDIISVSNPMHGVCLLAVSLLVSVGIGIYFRIMREHRPRKKYERIIDAARKAGRVHHGHLIKTKLERRLYAYGKYSDKGGERAFSYGWVGYYEYEYKYICHVAKIKFAESAFSADVSVPTDLDLYYKSSRPHYVYSEYPRVITHQQTGLIYKLYYIIPVLFAIFAWNFLYFGLRFYMYFHMGL